MSVDIAEKQQLIEAHASKSQNAAQLAAGTAVFTKPSVALNGTDDYRKYQY